MMNEKHDSAKNAMKDWLRLIAAETEEDLAEIEHSTSVPEIKDCINKLREMSRDEQIQAEAQRREQEIKEAASE